MQPERLLVSKYGKNALGAAALPRAPLGELAALPPRPLAGLWEGKMRKRKGGEEMSQRRERGGRTKKGRGIGKKEGEEILLISFAPTPSPNL